jgi:hypothetical protein
VLPVPEPSRKEDFEQAAGGGKMPIKKSAVYIFINKKEKMSRHQLNYLDQLEAESIYILRRSRGTV